MKIIGLTGGIASGKSTASQILRELGAAVIDTDKLAHRIMEPEQPAWHDIVEHFGPEVLNQDKTIDRAAMSAIVFRQPDRLELLNRITHPRVFEMLRQELAHQEAQRPDGPVFIEAAILFESGLDEMCDEVWVVWVDSDTQIKRLMERNGFDREEAARRIAAQMPLDEKARRAEVLIDNRGDLEQLRHRTEQAYRALI
ncbi:MAG: dephospho-CoA kinase [Syntrophomonadaceae bacterium]|nr:dephospho-CoA kinase [Syntrophomonadaceae bacterium]